MFKNALLISLFMVSSSALLHGGHGWSQLSKTNSEKNTSTANPYEPYTRELSTYLEALKLDNIKKTEIQTHVETVLNRDICDAKKFPLFNAFMKEQQSKRDEKKGLEVEKAVRATIGEFLAQKGVPLDEGEDEDEYKQIDNNQ